MDVVPSFSLTYVLPVSCLKAASYTFSWSKRQISLKCLKGFQSSFGKYRNDTINLIKVMLFKTKDDKLLEVGDNQKCIGTKI